MLAFGSYNQSAIRIFKRHFQKRENSEYDEYEDYEEMESLIAE